MNLSENHPKAVTAAKSITQPSPRITVAAFAAAILAAVLLPGNRIGIGVLLVAVVGATALVVASPSPDRPVFVTCLSAAVALSATSAFLAAEWVVAVNFIAAVGLTVLAVTGSRAWVDLVAGPMAFLLRTRPSLGFVLKPISSRLPTRKDRAGIQTVAGLVTGALLIVVFGALFVSGDKAFGSIAGDWFEGWDLGLFPFRLFVFLVVLIGTGALILAGSKYAGKPEYLSDLLTAISTKRPRMPQRTWSLALGLLDTLFVSFALFQLVVFFGGNDFVLDTAGLTYAEYAREGFFQLLASCILAIGVVAIAYTFSDASTARSKLMLGVLAGVLMTACLVVCISAIRRMQLYEQAFGFSQARLVAHAFLLWIAGLLILGLVAIGIRRSGWLPAATVMFSALALLIFSGVNPDRLVARHNVERFEKTGKIDSYYLTTLGPDAAPELERLPFQTRACVLKTMGRNLKGNDPWMSFNVGRNKARKIVKQHVRHSQPECALLVTD